MLRSSKICFPHRFDAFGVVLESVLKLSRVLACSRAFLRRSSLEFWSGFHVFVLFGSLLLCWLRETERETHTHTLFLFFLPSRRKNLFDTTSAKFLVFLLFSFCFGFSLVWFSSYTFPPVFRSRSRGLLFIRNNVLFCGYFECLLLRLKLFIVCKSALCSISLSLSLSLSCLAVS